MPGFDRTGPEGAGPKSGRKMGRCVETQPANGSGPSGMGRGRRHHGRGRGLRYRYRQGSAEHESVHSRNEWHIRKQIDRLNERLDRVEDPNSHRVEGE